MNNVMLVGRLVKNPEVKEGKALITLAITRPYKNLDGTYDTDFVDCVLWNGITQNVSEYCKTGDIVGVKGRLQSDEDKIQVIAEKVTFLTSKKEAS